MRKIKRFWFVPVIALLIVGGLVVWWWYAFHAGGGRPIFTIGKETTYVDGPVLESGHIDYVTALNERLGKGITPENNAQVLIVKALGPRPEGTTRMSAEYYKWLGIEEPPEKGEYFVQLHKYLDKHLKMAPGEEEDPLEIEMELEKKRDEVLENLEKVAKRAWKASDHPHIAAWLKANEKPLAVVVEATRRPKYFHPMVPPQGKATGIIGALLPTVQVCLELSAAFAARAMLRTGEGRYEQAWQDLLTCHRLGRTVSRGATMIEMLVGFAIESVAAKADLAYMSQAKLEAGDIKKRLNDLKKLPPLSTAAEKINLGERFAVLDAVMMVDRGGIDTLSRASKHSPLTGKVNWDPAMQSINLWYDRMVGACKEKDRNTREKKIGKIGVQVTAKVVKPSFVAGLFMTRYERGLHMGNILVGLLIPAISKVREAEDRVAQQQQNLYIAFALAAYHSDHGRYPDKLERLAPAYLESVPNDLFTGKALIYRLTKGGYLLYSVGVNGQDENGQGADDEPVGDDLSVRMPVLSPGQR